MPVTVPQPTDDLNWHPADANVQEPSSGKKALGWVVNETIPSEETNWFWRAVSRWIAYTKDVVVNSYGAQHDIVTGAHTAITAITGVFSTSLTSPLYNFSPTGGIRLLERFLITQTDPFGLTGTSGSIDTVSFVGRTIKVLTLDVEETGLIPIGHVSPGTDVDQIILNIKIGGAADYQFTWRLYVFDQNGGVWENPPGGMTTGNISGTDLGTGFTSITINLPDQTPLVAGHGVGGFTNNRLLGIALSNFPAASSSQFEVFHVSVVKWVASINTALSAG